MSQSSGPDDVERRITSLVAIMDPQAVLPQAESVPGPKRLDAALAALERSIYQQATIAQAANARTQEIVEVLLDMAALNFSRRAGVNNTADAFDAIAAGVNMLSEEIDAVHTLLKKRSTELSQQGQLLQSILDSMADGVVVADATGKLLVFNRAAETLLGMKPSDMHPEQWGSHYGYFLADRQTPFPTDDVPLVRAIRGEPTNDVDMFVQNANVPQGRFLHVIGRPLSRADGAPAAGLVVFRDVTDERRGIEALQRLAAIVETTEEAILSYDLAGNIQSWNRGAEKLYGYATAEILGLPVRQLVPTDRLAEFEDIFEKVQRGEQVHQVETVRQRKDGSLVEVVITKSPLHDSSGRCVGVSVVGHDISERKRVQAELLKAKAEAEDATRTKSEFLANMSHEIRTPLSAVLGFADMLLDMRVSESERLNYVMTIRRNGEHLLALLNDILDLSKIEAGKMNMELMECGLVPLLHEVASLMRVRAIDKGLGFTLTNTTPLPSIISTDPTRLRQVLLNLVSNAIKFTEAGRVQINVRCTTTEAATPMLHIEVIDTGIGIASDQLARLFLPFRQADPSTTRRFGGSGLGLAICRPLAGALGGTIQVESRPGHGSLFRLSLPLPSLDGIAMIDNILEIPQTQTTAPDAGNQASFVVENLRVLLAEDGFENQLLISTILRKHGIQVQIAENGAIAVDQALKAWRAGAAFDVILMDMQMPELDGYAAAATLRRHKYPGPVVALTAHAMTGERERCLSAGCDHYLTKPVDRAVLIQTIAAYAAPKESSHEAIQSQASQESATTYRSSFADDPDMRDLVHDFVRRLPQLMHDMRAAFAASDCSLLRRLAHQLKGAAGGYGFYPLTEAAASLENAAARESLDRVDVCLRELLHRCEKVTV